MSAPTPAQVADWRKQLDAHTMRDGRCPECKVPYRCRDWADAFANLLAHGHSPTTATPAQAPGGNPTAGSTGGDTA